MTQPRPQITKDGQPFVDEPIYIKPKGNIRMASAVVVALDGQDLPPSPIFVEPKRTFARTLKVMPAPLLVGYERIRLIWRRPGNATAA